MIILFYYFLLLNVLAFILTAYDKRQAIKQKRRISEKVLLSFVLFGGTIGSGLGMLTFRHKTSKPFYLWKFWTIVVVQILITFVLFFV
ncbi:DUF1294 domain-containing protein [Flavobacterium sp.]|uniref:DUF1294 domain-containing protein n=1 Tax=Flavobacterium sp. TaxID=239 RepID=UPI003C4251D7